MDVTYNVFCYKNATAMDYVYSHITLNVCMKYITYTLNIYFLIV